MRHKLRYVSICAASHASPHAGRCGGGGGLAAVSTTTVACPHQPRHRQGFRWLRGGGEGGGGWRERERDVNTAQHTTLEAIARAKPTQHECKRKTITSSFTDSGMTRHDHQAVGLRNGVERGWHDTMPTHIHIQTLSLFPPSPSPFSFPLELRRTESADPPPAIGVASRGRRG